MTTVEDTPVLDLLGQLESKSPQQRKDELLTFHDNKANGEMARKKVAYVLAKILKRTGTEEDIKQALPLFQEAEGVPSLSGHAASYAADCAKFLGDDEMTRRELKNAIAATQEPLAKALPEYTLAQIYFRAGEPDEAGSYLENIIKEAPESQFAIGSKYYLGQIKYNAGQQTEGLALWRQYLKECPDGRYGPQILPVLKTLPDLTSEDHLLIAESHFYHGEPDKALLEWSKAGDTTHWLMQAQCLFRLGKPTLARQSLLNGIRSHPADPAVLEAAQILCRPISKEDAIKVWQTVLASGPQFADVALFNIANRAPDEQKVGYYCELLKRFPDSEYAPESSWWVLWNKILKGQNESALTDAKQFSQKYASARSAARFCFWQGKLLERLKQTDAAKEIYARTVDLYPRDYYGHRSAGRLAALNGDKASKDPAWSTDFQHSLKIYAALGSKWNWPEPPQLLPYDKIESTYGPTASMLAQLRQWDECLDLAPAKDCPCPQLRSICLAKLGRPLEAINTMSKDLSGKPGDALDWQLSYPLLFARIMSSEGGIKKVDPLLAQALTREESRYNVDAVSRSNARGLMQLLPPTAYGVAKRLSVPLSGVRDIHKPEVNLKLGIDYLAYTLSRFGGNAMLAVASYNAGPNGVAGFTKKYSMADPDMFVEQIPYTETRDYVRKVFSSYWNYKATYGRYLTLRQ